MGDDFSKEMVSFLDTKEGKLSSDLAQQERESECNYSRFWFSGEHERVLFDTAATNIQASFSCRRLSSTRLACTITVLIFFDWIFELNRCSFLHKWMGCGYPSGEDV